MGRAIGSEKAVMVTSWQKSTFELVEVSGAMAGFNVPALEPG
jgi:hypothetical protein